MSQLEIVCEDLGLAIDDLKRQGFRLDVIYPADEPGTAILSRGGDSVRVAIPGAPRLPEGLPPFRPQFVLSKAAMAPGLGRAGMLYSDLIPGRLGGRYIASHILISEGGPVSDWVHYHHVALQLIAVRRGWVRVAYEDQGEPFVMNEGDLVLQPPGIRHRVLESSAGLEVVEISAPALHETLADHQLELPNGNDPDGNFNGQRFLHHVALDTSWTSWNGAQSQETALRTVTDGLADARTIRPGTSPDLSFAPHSGELVFGFVLDGTAMLGHGDGVAELGTANAFVIPPEEAWELTAMSTDFQLLHVTTALLGH